ncbi:phage virion morphogenesis protein [Cupriavidus sp. SZY C1]|uniref:phage virion morphogenesis protein n=1 Tax=Cupriavidus sp. SZY C1 TaxID=3055037 RepID=UPI0028B82287|nr:phage virion morphogenesis protein [Cupriavidus sp. SZY C1]MDT6962690.1 phage virion morphogenesis protein [Cupriavidus sp. SZY C1]
MSDLDDLTAWAGALLHNLAPSQRRTLMRAIAAELRRRQTLRIAAQRNPDGTPYQPRKPRLRAKAGSVRRKMFGKLRTARFMKTQADANSAAVEFAASVRRIAAVHQFGLRDRVNRGGLVVEYAQRELLGLADGDVERLGDLVVGVVGG